MVKIIAGQCKHFSKQWLNEALYDLSRFDKSPIIDDFARQYGLKITNSKQGMLNNIRRNILSAKRKLSFVDLVLYLDKLKVYGKQHVIMYKLKNPEDEATKAYLDELRQSKKGKDLLSNNEVSTKFNKIYCHWTAKTPFLSEVSHTYNTATKTGKLIFKWVYTRGYQITGVPEDQQERSVNFFIINLENGTAELRIQTLPVMPYLDFNTELLIYESAISKLIDFDKFEVVSLESVMKNLLLEKILEISNWSVTKANGATVDVAGEGPSLYQKIFLINQRGVKPRELTAFWEDCQQVVGQKDLYFYLKNENNTILFNAITDRELVDYILYKIREGTDKFVVTPTPPNGKNGKNILDRSKEKFTKTKRSVVEAVTGASFLASGTLIGLLFNAITIWLKKQVFEAVFHIPYIILEVAVYLLLILAFYGRKRLARWFLLIPHDFVTRFLQLFLGKTADIIINSKNYLGFKAQQAHHTLPAT
jgi:hypothetical protein